MIKYVNQRLHLSLIIISLNLLTLSVDTLCAYTRYTVQLVVYIIVNKNALQFMDNLAAGYKDENEVSLIPRLNIKYI